MKTKHALIISQLIEHQTLTSKTLAQTLNFSVRTIKTLVKDINEAFPGTIYSSKQGYTLVKKEAITKISEYFDSTNSAAPRNQLIVRLISSTAPINRFDLAEEMFISISTLQNELQRIKAYLVHFDLKLVSKNNHLHIEGLEKNKRKVISDILYHQSNVDFMNYSTIQTLFPHIDLPLLKQIVTKDLEAKAYFINVILHLAIMIDRSAQQEYPQEALVLPKLNTATYHLCLTIAQHIEEHFNLGFSESALIELSILLGARATPAKVRHSDTLAMSEYIGLETQAVLQKIMTKLSDYYYIDLRSDSDLALRLSLHIKNLLIRAQHQDFNRNPLTTNIKHQSPLIYDIAVATASVIKEATGLAINDDEIAYIAFHIGSIVDTQRKLTQSIQALLYCPDYYGRARALAAQLSQCFGDCLLINAIISDEEEIAADESIDLLITTVPLNGFYLVPVQEISLFLKPSDYNNLKVRLDQLHLQRKRQVFKETLKGLLPPNLFELATYNASRDEILKHIANRLYHLGYTTKNYYEKVLEREHLSSTAFEQFAIPHTMKMEAKKTGIYLLIHKGGIDWQGQKVHLVMMLCFSPDERSLFNDLFDQLTEVLMQARNRLSIIESNHYEEVIEKIVNGIQ